ncbi:MAG: cobalt ECF transporter T component CbiQ [Desulfuromonadia bacterium]
MIIEEAAYRSRLRRVDTPAKGIATLAGITAAFLSPEPVTCGGIATLFAMVTIWGGGIGLSSYLRAFLPPLSFLLIGSLSLLVSLDPSSPFWVTIDPGGEDRLLVTTSRAIATLSTLIFLSLTTPMTDLAALARRIGVPETLVEIMTVAYRMIFVFLDTFHDIRTAQSARLGYADLFRSVHSARTAVAALATRVFMRAAELSRGAEARNLDVELRGLSPTAPHPFRDRIIAITASILLISTVAIGRRG